MIAITIELVVMILLAWAITYLTYEYDNILGKLSLTVKNKIRLEKKEVDRITDIFYRYFYFYIGYFLISNFLIIDYIDNKILFHSFGIGFAIFFLYLQTYVIYRWKVIIKSMKNEK